MMELKIPPPIIGLTTALLMWVCSKTFFEFSYSSDRLHVVAALIAVAGLFIEFEAVLRFFRSRTTINPLRPGNTTSLSVSGMNRFSRNPMYLGMLLLLAAWALWLGNPLNVFFLGGFVWVISRFQIEPEERILRAKFGQSYADYFSNVRRWI